VCHAAGDPQPASKSDALAAQLDTMVGALVRASHIVDALATSQEEPQQRDAWISVQKAADLLGMKEARVRTLAAKKLLKARRDGGRRWQISGQDCLRLLDEA